MDARLSAIVNDLQAVQQRLRQLHRWLPREAWSQTPAPGRWSPAECVTHLNLTSRAMLPLLHDGLRRASVSPIGPPSRYRREFNARVKYNLYAALTLVSRHQQRHALQAERAASVPIAEPSPLAV